MSRETSQLLFTHWIDGPSVCQSDQLEEVGRYRQRDFKKARTDRERGMVTKIEGSREFLVEQRAKHWAEFARIWEHQGAAALVQTQAWYFFFNKDCSIIPPSLASAESFIIKLYNDTFNGDSPETTILTQPYKNLDTQSQGMNMQNVGEGLIGGGKECIRRDWAFIIIWQWLTVSGGCHLKWVVVVIDRWWWWWWWWWWMRNYIFFQ